MVTPRRAAVKTDESGSSTARRVGCDRWRSGEPDQEDAGAAGALSAGTAGGFTVVLLLLVVVVLEVAPGPRANHQTARSRTTMAIIPMIAPIPLLRSSETTTVSRSRSS